MAAKLLIESYQIMKPKVHGDGREGTRWSTQLMKIVGRGHNSIAKINNDGDGGCLRWDFGPGPSGVHQRKQFDLALLEWIQTFFPGAELREFCEVDATWVDVMMFGRGHAGLASEQTKALLERSRMPVPTLHAPNWLTLENRLSRLIHSMKLGYSSLMSLGYPLQDIMSGQKIAIQRMEEWVADKEIDVDSWRTLDHTLGGLSVPMWCCYNAENLADHLTLGFSSFSPVGQWDTIVAPMVKLTVHHRTPVLEEEAVCEDCGGTGELEGMGSRADCPKCNGKGTHAR